MSRWQAAVGAASVCAALCGVLSACSGGGTAAGGGRTPGVTRTAGTGSGSGTGSSTSSGARPGPRSEQDPGGPAGTGRLPAAVDSYRRHVLAEVATVRVAARRFTDAVRAGDLARARELYAPSRYGWEGIEPIAALVPDIDAAVDSRVDDFAGPDDSRFTGWHRLEYLLWARRTTAGAAPFADRLDADLATLEAGIRKVTITARAMVLGAGDLVEEVSKGKITGEEDRYSHTDLWDFAGNIEGAQAVFRSIAPMLAARNSALYTPLVRGFAAVAASLARYRTSSGGYRPYTALRADDKVRMQAQLATVSEDLARVVAALGI